MYKLTTNPDSIILLPSTFIPKGNTLWLDYEDWLSQGNIPEPADIIPEPIVTEIDARRAKLALNQMGLYTTIQSTIESMGIDAQINWKDATVWRKSDPLVSAIATGLELTDSDIDELFLLASTL